jgi:hypothetical protein
MPGEGLGAVSAVVSYASNLFSYLSPTRSPYYATTVACVVALCWTFAVGRGAWIALYVPIAVLLVILTLFTLRSPKFWFNRSEYNDQLKFARSLAVTSSVVCVTFLILNSQTPLGYHQLYADGDAKAPCTGADCHALVQVANLGAYIICLCQMLLFLTYEFVFGRFDERVLSLEQTPADERLHPAGRLAERNYVQIALIMSTYLAGITTVVDYAKEESAFMALLLGLFAALWLVCATHVLLFVQRNFKMEQPPDVEPLEQAGNVIKLKHVG